MPQKRRKIRADFRKNREQRTRQNDLTKAFEPEDDALLDLPSGERVSGKGATTRKRTIIVDENDASDAGASTGRVLQVQGLTTYVRDDATGKTFECATRRVLKSLATDERHVVAVGDRVVYRQEGDDQGMIERIEPRGSELVRATRGRKQIIAANVDQVLVVVSAAQPALKPHLVDRYLVTAERAGIEPVIVLNKLDLVEPSGLQPLVGVWAQLGYRVLCTSIVDGRGLAPLRDLLADRTTALSGQSGVGKSSLLNAVQPGLSLGVSAVSRESEKGRHTTTSAVLLPLSFGGFVVDTPGLRQFQLWDVIPEEVAGFFRDIHPWVNLCRYPDCRHAEESECAVKHAVADGMIDERRYTSYLGLITEEAAS